MAGPFETATRAAIEDLIHSHSKLSKFGMVLTHENAQNLVDDLFQLLLTSRNLKSIGDRMLQTPAPKSEPKARPSPHGKKVNTTVNAPQRNANSLQKDTGGRSLRETFLGSRNNPFSKL
jgi:hypothetical protein